MHPVYSIERHVPLFTVRSLPMSELSFRDRELVALGAALASNCEPCVEYHVAEALKAGLTANEINAAITLADKIRQVPARKPPKC